MKQQVQARVWSSWTGTQVTQAPGNPSPTAAITQPGGNPSPTSKPTQPTATSIPAGTTALSLQILLHGLGKGGDNVNAQSGGNVNPLHPLRTVTVEINNASNQLVATKQGTINYQASSGSFTGIISLGQFPSGVYTLKVKVPQYLAKAFPGIVSVTAGQTTNISPVSLTTGDSNGDNKLSILDYNMLLDCFSDLTPAKNCADSSKKNATDLTDDSKVNQFDYNLFLRELSVQSGG